MAGVGVISSVAVFLFVLLASFSAARQERSLRAAWAKVESTEQGTFKYLTLLIVGADAKCSGSIPSKWTVLTFCKEATADGKTKAFAGLLDVAEATGTDSDTIQVRNVTNVAEKKGTTGLKICTLNKIWDFNGNVGFITVSARTSDAGCTALGFGPIPAPGGPAKLARKQGVSLTIETNTCGGAGNGISGSKFTAGNEDKEKFGDLDLGGPVVCGAAQDGINMKYDAASNLKCNLYLDLAPHSTWIEEQKQAAEDAAADGADGTGGTGGTGGNGTASSGYSIHSHLNKYSNWKVLWFLVPTIVTFLQY